MKFISIVCGLMLAACHVPVDEHGTSAQTAPAESAPQPAQPPQTSAPEELPQVAYRCVSVHQRATGWCGKWELGCRGKGPYRLVATRAVPASCSGATPEVDLACETDNGVSRGAACQPWMGE
jgi:hypothetical protein